MVKTVLEKILAETIVVALKTETVAVKDLQTVMEKNIAFPTDSKLLNRARQQLTSFGV
ncbi:MAG: hypothetical protein ACRCYZ_00515 [Alphaproteobacteria bacterium]